MPRINLKPQSAEFADANEQIICGVCDMPGCEHNGEYRAPKDRSLNEYYHFCLEHVREYNKSWNFFSGMSDSEIEDHVVNSFYGDRPTWRYDNPGTEDVLRRKAWQTYNFAEKDPDAQRKQRFENKEEHTHYNGNRSTPEHEALAIMGLEPPVDLNEIKVRYKTLAKKYHPDLNKGCKKSEDLLKAVNMAYTILKVAFQKYENLPECP